MADYTGDSISEVLLLPCDLFQAYLRAAIIANYSRTKEGREYLQKAKRLTITTIDDKQFEQFTRGDNKWLLT